MRRGAILGLLVAIGAGGMVVAAGEFMKSWVGSVEASAKAGKSHQALADYTVPEKFKSDNMQRAKANIDVIYGEMKK